VVLLDIRAGTGLPDVVEDAHRIAQRTLELVQLWLSDERFAEGRLIVITHEAIAVREDDRVLDVAGSVVWGLMRSAQSESIGRVLLIDMDDSVSSWVNLIACAGSGEQQIVLRDGEILAPRMSFADLETHPEGPLFDPSRTALVTGGTGGLGILIARHLAGVYGMRSIVIASRRGPDVEGMSELRAELSLLGASVEIVSCDVAERSEVVALLDAVPAEYPLGAVVHSAAVLDDGVISSLTPERLHGVLRPKVDGAWYLHELTRELDLTAFVLFSSFAGIVGSPGQANYAAANTFVDALAAHRRSSGLAATSIAWGPWASPSNSTEALDGTHLERISRAGVVPLIPGEGLEIFDLAVAGKRADIMGLRLDFGTLRALARRQMLPPLLSELVGTPSSHSSNGHSSELTARLLSVAENERENVMVEFVQNEIAGLLGYASSDAVDSGLTFKELGFDSLGAVDLRNRLMLVTGLRLPTTLVFNYPTPVVLASYLLGQLALTPGEGTATIDSDLQKLETSVRSLVRDDGDHARIVWRVRELLSTLEAGDPDQGQGDVEGRIESATVAELFEMVENGLQIGTTADNGDVADENEVI
jgi:NAD(P)-dependent dehydrogenase (short-subunit alcohol dehydrogenase family)/acyl carrier protein